jgi:hypothetical protein
MEILLLYHPKIYEVFRRPFWKTVKIKNICFSWVFNVSQGPISNAKDYFSLALSVSELIGFFSLIFYFEMDSNKHVRYHSYHFKIDYRDEWKRNIFLFRNDIWCKYLDVNFDKTFVIDKYLWTNEVITRGDTFRFDSFISHSVEYIEVVKSLKGFLPTTLPSKVMAVLLNFRPIPMYLPKKWTYGISTWNVAHTQEYFICARIRIYA